MTGEGYSWIVSEQALTSAFVPEGKDLFFRLSIHTLFYFKYGSNVFLGDFFFFFTNFFENLSPRKQYKKLLLILRKHVVISIDKTIYFPI